MLRSGNSLCPALADGRGASTEAHRRAPHSDKEKAGTGKETGREETRGEEGAHHPTVHQRHRDRYGRQPDGGRSGEQRHRLHRHRLAGTLQTAQRLHGTLRILHRAGRLRGARTLSKRPHRTFLQAHHQRCDTIQLHAEEAGGRSGEILQDDSAWRSTGDQRLQPILQRPRRQAAGNRRCGEVCHGNDG